jgi:hypothetical protein
MFEYQVPTEHKRGRSSLMQHRAFLGLYRKQLDGAAMNLLHPEEQLIGTFDATTKHPSLREASITFTALGLWFPAVGISNGDVGPWVVPAAVLAAVGMLGLIFLHLTGSRQVMFAITTHGLVECRLDLLGRPRSILSRSPAAAPDVLQRPLGWRRIALGNTTVWVKYSLDPLLTWMKQEACLRSS